MHILELHFWGVYITIRNLHLLSSGVIQMPRCFVIIFYVVDQIVLEKILIENTI